MSAAGVRRHDHGLCSRVGACGLHRSSCFWIKSGSPCNSLNEWSAGNELAGCTIEHIEESVLVRLHDDFSRLAVDCDIGLHQWLRGVVVPVVAGRSLEIPGEFAGACVQREDGCGVEIRAIALS